ncbi:MAG TPA: P-loop NTPase fold protein, partial [Pyrinomonadaceae bacterium]
MIDGPSTRQQSEAAPEQASVTAPESLRGPCITKLVSDKPVEQVGSDDEGAHKRLASALADLMRGEEKGGVSVGLEGDWGSGKTSVLMLFKQELRDAGELIEPSPEDEGQEGEKAAGAALPAPGSGAKDFAVITFDAWAHEKDPLRRTFLETIIPHLLSIGWVRKSDSWRWKRRLQIIAQRLESKTTDSSPRLEPAGVAAVLSLFLVPIGHDLFSEALKTTQFVWDPDRPIAWRLLVGLFLMVLPLLVVASAYVRWWLSGSGERPSLWALLFNKGITSERTRTFKTANPTSIEFEHEFTQLMKETLEGKVVLDEDEEKEQEEAKRKRDNTKGAVVEADVDYKRRRLVLVFDNLDRVDTADALTIWSTLQTFLGSPNAAQSAWFDRLWILVLYDPRGLRLLWDKIEEKRLGQPGERAAPADPTSAAGVGGQAAKPAPGGSAEASKAGPGGAPGGQDAKPATPAAAVAGAPAGQAPGAVEGWAAPVASAITRAASTSFMDKSFQIRFEVPPPVLSDWRQRLRGFLDDAIPRHAGEFDSILGVYRLYLSETEQYPTYRELKLFANQIGSLHRQWAKYCGPAPTGQEKNWEERFPLSNVAYYVLLRRRGVDVVKGLLGGRLPEDSYKGLLGPVEQARDTLAALAFNVRRRTARQIVLGKPIGDALERGAEGAAKLAELKESHDGFWGALKDVLDARGGESVATPEDADRLNRAIQCIHRSGMFDSPEPDNDDLGGAVKVLCMRAAAVAEWPSFDSPTAEGLAALCRWARHPKVWHDGWHDRVEFESNLLKNVSRSLQPDEKVRPVEKAGQWLENVSVVAAEIFTEVDDAPEKQQQHAAILDQIAAQLLPEDVEVFTDEGRMLKAKYQEHPPARLSLLLEALMILRNLNPGGSEMQQVINQLVNIDYSLLHYLEDAYSAPEGRERTQALARSMFLHLNEDPSASQRWGISTELEGSARLRELLSASEEDEASASPNAPGVNLAEEFVYVLNDHGRLPLLFELLDKAAERKVVEPFVARCLRVVADDRNFGKILLTRETLVERWPDIYRLVNGDERPLAGALREHIRSLPADEMALAVRIFDDTHPMKKLYHDGPREYVWLYAEVVGSSAESMKALDQSRKRWTNTIYGLDAERWRREVLEWGALYELTFVLQQKGQFTVVPKHYVEGMLEAAKAVIEGEPTATRPPERAPTVLLGTSADASVSDALYQSAADAGWVIPEEFFDQYGRSLAESDQLREGSLARILEPMLKKRNAPGLRWLHGVLAENSELQERIDFPEFISLAQKDIEEHRNDLAAAIMFEIGKIVGVVDPSAVDHPRFEIVLFDVGPQPASVLDLITLNTSVGSRAKEII